MKTSKIPKGAVTESKRVAVTKSVSADDINEFISYCNKFYGKAGIYKDQLNGGFSVTEIKKAVLKYLKDLDENPTWGDGDSLDRERVRQILQPSYSPLAKGGMTDGMYYVVSGKQGKVISKGFVTEEEAKVKMYRLYERNNDISMAIKRMAKGGKTKESTSKGKIYIEYLNKSKGFKRDRKYFDSDDQAIKWGRKNLGNFNMDMLRYEYAQGGVTEHGLRKGDTITDDMFWSNEAIVRDSKGEKHKVNLEQGKRYAGGGMTHSVAKLKRFFKQYLKNEDENYHSENVVLLAKTFGSKNDVKEATEILKEHDRIGYLSDDLYEKRKELDKKLYPIAKRIMDMNQINMAKGGMIGGFSYSIGGL